MIFKWKLMGDGRYVLAGGRNKGAIIYKCA